MMRVDDHLLRDVMALYNKTGLQVCDGQQLDLNFEKRDSIRMDEYMKMIELKTAVLLAGCLRLGAVIAETSDVNKDLIEELVGIWAFLSKLKMICWIRLVILKNLGKALVEIF